MVIKSAVRPIRHVKRVVVPLFQGSGIRIGPDLALQLQGSLEVSLLRHSLMASPPDGPRDDERRLDPALG